MESEPTPQQLAELSALADGSLPAERRPAVRSMIAASPELSGRFEREQWVVDALRELGERERAPLRLRQQLEAARPTPRARRTRRISYGFAVAGGLAVIALVLVLALPGGTPGAPSLASAAVLGTRTSTQSAPRPAATNPYSLNQAVGGLAFPNWSPQGWTAFGQRADRLGGHRAVTVFYRRGSEQIAYTILAAPPLQRPEAPIRVLSGLRLQRVELGGRTVVTWRRGASTCVLSGDTVAAGELEFLAGAY
jgi:anti-sigma factor RsiW